MNTTSNRNRPDLPAGRIDIHSHLLPGIDDGCADLDESLQAVRRLQELGFVGSVCTPHLWPEAFPENTPRHVEAWTLQLADQLNDAGIQYQVWPGGELRIFDGAIEWMKVHGVPTLTGSRLVLTDFWVEHWPGWIMDVYEWLLAHRYRPILAHPERLQPTKDLEPNLSRLMDMGVWLQGNLRSFTGEDGFFTDQQARRHLHLGQYRFLALDMHRPDSLESRLDGIQILTDEFGTERMDQLLVDAPRRWVLGMR